MSEILILLLKTQFGILLNTLLMIIGLEGYDVVIVTLFHENVFLVDSEGGDIVLGKFYLLFFCYVMK